jgi:hypothetical protein
MVTATSALDGFHIIILVRSPSPLEAISSDQLGSCTRLEKEYSMEILYMHTVTLYILSLDRGVAYVYIPVLITRTKIVGAGLAYPKGNFLLAKKASLRKEFTLHCKEATEHSTLARRRLWNLSHCMEPPWKMRRGCVSSGNSLTEFWAAILLLWGFNRGE